MSKKQIPISICSGSFAILGSNSNPERLNGFPEKWRATERQVERERGKQMRVLKKLSYEHYHGLKIIAHNHENAHSLREMMNTPGAEEPTSK